MNCYKADPVSRADIRRYVYMLKKKVGLEEELYFPILPFVENVLPMLIPDFQFQVVPVAEMGVKHGETYPSKNLNERSGSSSPPAPLSLFFSK